VEERGAVRVVKNKVPLRAHLQSDRVESKACEVLSHIDAVIRTKSCPFGDQLGGNVMHFCSRAVSDASSPKPA